MSGFLRSYLSVAVFAAAAGLLVGAILGLSRLLQPRRPTAQKLIAYESGVDPFGEGWSQSQIRYYVFALLFVLFDVEVVFIFPWAVRVDQLATFGLLEAIVILQAKIREEDMADRWTRGEPVGTRA